jgi:hypothetical protein
MVQDRRARLPTVREDIEPPAPQGELEGFIAHSTPRWSPPDYFHPPARTPSTRQTIRTMLTKPALVVERSARPARHAARDRADLADLDFGCVAAHTRRSQLAPHTGERMPCPLSIV